MKDDFLTIPTFPNYEINSDLLVRNKKTGTILTATTYGIYTNYYCLRYNGRSTTRTATSWRKFAEESFKPQEKWVPVPSLKNKYEINDVGELRNAKTKRKLLLGADGSYNIYLDGLCKKARLKSLMWEAHGKPYKPQKAVTVIAVKDRLALRFDNLKKCAQYLAPIIHYAVKTIRSKLSKRLTELAGWRFFYEEDNLQNVQMTVSKALKGVVHYEK